MNTSLIDDQNWIIVYNRVKSDYQQKRKFSALLPPNESKDLLDRMVMLEKSLNVMKDSPME